MSPTAHERLVIVPENIRKCVVFLGYVRADGSPRLAGSGFFVGREGRDGAPNRVYLATARHVVDGIRGLGLTEMVVRANTKAGQAVWAKCSVDDWMTHPSDTSIDVALLNAGISDDWDHLALDISLFANPEKFAQHEVGLGDEVFVVGLFRHHHGTQRNIPIVRVGNLAALTEERVNTRTFGEMEAYLVEARSIGGLSGSPVFLNLGSIRYVDKQIKQATNGHIFFLLGLVHGHYDAPGSAVDGDVADASDPLSVERVNTGIAIVTPAEKVLEIMNAFP